MYQNRARLIAAAALSACLCGPAGAALPCDADLDRSGDVGIVDLLDLLSLWGTNPGGPPDFDGGGVGISDLLSLLARWGPIAIDYGKPPADPEAEQIGLEMLGSSGPVLLPADVYQRVRFDLLLIRGHEPSLADEAHTPAWVPNQLLVQLVPAAPLDEYLCLNEIHQVIDADLLFGTLYVLTFAGNLNVEALVQVYSGAPEVDFAEPNGIIGGQNVWTPTDLGGGVWQWQVDDAWCDCFDGCDCHRVWIFETDAEGNIQTIGVQEFGFPWCNFKNDTC